MDLWIRFLGLMLLYQAHAGAPYQVLIPKWEKGDKFCGTEIMEHTPWIRISTGSGDVVDDSQWKVDTPCNPDQHCALYRIPEDSTLSIDPGVTLATEDPDVIPCLIPDFGGEKLVRASSAKLHRNALTTRSAVDYVAPKGTFYVHQIVDGQGILGPMFFALRVPLPASAAHSNIRVVATPRSGGAPHVLVLKAGTVIDIMDAPKEHAVMSDDVVETNPLERDRLNGHFFFLHKLLDVPKPEELVDEQCQFIRPTNQTPGCAGERKRFQPIEGSTKTEGCGPGYVRGGV